MCIKLAHKHTQGKTLCSLADHIQPGSHGHVTMHCAAVVGVLVHMQVQVGSSKAQTQGTTYGQPANSVNTHTLTHYFCLQSLQSKIQQHAARLLHAT
jgi:FtsZ-interacting cell division protein ZipA